jgi:hypothetical protein
MAISKSVKSSGLSTGRSQVSASAKQRRPVVEDVDSEEEEVLDEEEGEGEVILSASKILNFMIRLIFVDVIFDWIICWALGTIILAYAMGVCFKILIYFDACWIHAFQYDQCYANDNLFTHEFDFPMRTGFGSLDPFGRNFESESIFSFDMDTFGPYFGMKLLKWLLHNPLYKFVPPYRRFADLLYDLHPSRIKESLKRRIRESEKKKKR